MAFAQMAKYDETSPSLRPLVTYKKAVTVLHGQKAKSQGQKIVFKMQT